MQRVDLTNKNLQLPDLPPNRFRIKTTPMSAPKDDLLKAIELAMADKWDAAHELVQPYEDDAMAVTCSRFLYHLNQRNR